MSEFTPKTLSVSGRLPALTVAELEALYGPGHTRPIPGAVLLDLAPQEIDFGRLGGTVKLARILNILDTTSWPQLERYLIDNIPPHLQDVPEGTFTLGLSVYGLEVPVKIINTSMMKIKKRVRAAGRSMRVVPNKTLDLNSAQVLHNKLTTRGAWELLLVKDGGKTILGQTLFVQDIEAYAARDQARPKRDARTGMLPPKLAQTLINLSNPPKGGIILDPFCGSGVILQEAMLMDFKAIGTDIDPRMVSFARSNIDWLKSQKPDLKAAAEIGIADALNASWEAKVDAVVSEIYLGKPLSHPPSPDALGNIVREVDSLLAKFLKNIGGQIKKGTVLSLAVPAWRRHGGKLARLPILEKITDMGYNYLDFEFSRREDLLYFREDQVVARQIIRLNKE